MSLVDVFGLKMDVEYRKVSKPADFDQMPHNLQIKKLQAIEKEQRKMIQLGEKLGEDLRINLGVGKMQRQFIRDILFESEFFFDDAIDESSSSESETEESEQGSPNGQARFSPQKIATDPNIHQPKHKE